MAAIKLGIVMDPIDTINPKKDSSLAMLLAAQARDWELYYLEPKDLYYLEGTVYMDATELSVADSLTDWFKLGKREQKTAADFDIMLMRKDPPFDMEFVYCTYMLEQLERDGVLVVNRPASLRDVNEKYATTWFPQCAPASMVSADPLKFREFLEKHHDIIVKPLDGMGGASIFRIKAGDTNTGVILETLLDFGKTTAMAQVFLPDYVKGDKRILLIDGEPVDYALARIPSTGEGRANLAAGGKGVGQPLTERDRWICAELKDEIKARGLYFVGIDVIGDYLTEVNVTSPTCIRELDSQFDLDIGGALMDCLATKLN